MSRSLLSLTNDLYSIFVFAVAVKGQQRIRCYVAANCDINQPIEAIMGDDYVSVCCNYPSAGVRPRGFAYSLIGHEGCSPCPKG